MKRMWCHLAVIAAVMVFSSVASAGVIGDFQVEALGVYVEQGDQFLIEADVFAQDPNLGFEAYGSVFDVDELGDPDTFEGFFTLVGNLGDLTALAAGVVFFEDGFVGLAGVFEITSGTGAFEGVSGGGIITAIGTGDDAGVMYVDLVGNIVPAPAALALFGAAGLVTRRRRRN